MLPDLFVHIACHEQLLQNIVKSNELQFPPNLKDLSSDCKDLCQKLLRRDPGLKLYFFLIWFEIGSYVLFLLQFGLNFVDGRDEDKVH